LKEPPDTLNFLLGDKPTRKNSLSLVISLFAIQFLKNMTPHSALVDLIANLCLMQEVTLISARAYGQSGQAAKCKVCVMREV